MNDLALAIGKRVRDYRKQQGISQEELAEKSGLHHTYIGQIERGEKNVTVETLKKILDAMGISLSRFFEYFETKQTTQNIPHLCYELLNSRSPREQQAIHEIIYAVLDIADYDSKL